MAEPPNSTGAGFFDHFNALLAAGSAYLHARLRLAGIESKDALIHYAIIIGLVMAGLVVVAFGYLFLCIGLIALLAAALRVHAGWVLLAFAFLHFAVAVVCGLIAKTKLSVPMFSATLDEFKKDQQWMSTPRQN
jgi:uncharacterized membrane protein YqjE